MSKIKVNDSISDTWVYNYLGFLSDEKLLVQRREKPYPLMNKERQDLIDPVRDIALILLPLATQYPDLRNFIELFNIRFVDMMQWLEKYSDMIPKVDPNPEDLDIIEQHKDLTYGLEDFKHYPLIPIDDLIVFVHGFNTINKIIFHLAPFYKAFPHASSRVSSFIFDLPHEYSETLSRIHSNFKSGRYKVI